MKDNSDPYGSDVLAGTGPAKRSTLADQRTVEAIPGLLVEDVHSGFVGEIVRVEKVAGELLMTLSGRGDTTRRFPLGPGYWIDGQPVVLVPPAPAAAPRKPERTASGSVRAASTTPAVMAPSRIWVEGRHDWQLIDKVWGEDLRGEGVAVEELAGVDHLADMLTAFRPGPERKAGVLVDHFVPGSKESRLVGEALAAHGNGYVLVVGHPYVDVWQAIKPARVGLAAWPDIPKGTDIKKGTLAHLGLPNDTTGDVGRGWSLILDRVRSWKDLESSLIKQVETLIDFVTTGATAADFDL